LRFCSRVGFDDADMGRKPPCRPAPATKSTCSAKQLQRTCRTKQVTFHPVNSHPSFLI
jgi:hypothetical protein